MNLKEGDNCPTMRKMMLEIGNYDDFVACCVGNVEDVINVVKKLL